MKKYTRHSKSKIFDILRRFNNSGLSRRQFCRNEGLVPSTFYNWKKKYSDELNHTNSYTGKPAFIPLRLKENDNKASVNASPIEISFPNGIQIRCTSEINFDDLRKLIR